MQHLALAATLAAFGTGLASLGLFLGLYRAGRSPLIRSYLLYLACGLLQLLAGLVGLYASAAGLAADPDALSRAYYFTEVLASGALAYAAPRFFLEFADLPFRGGPRRAAIGLSAATLASSPLALVEGGAPFLRFIPPSLGLLSFLGLMLYSQYRLVRAYRGVQDRLGRIGIPAILAYNAFCLAAGTVDSGLSAAQLAAGAWPYGALLRPATYLAWYLLSLAWAARYEGSGALAAGASGPTDRERALALGLTGREFELASLLSTGAANKEIAAALGLSANTVRNHVHNMFEKTGARNRVELVRLLSGDPAPAGRG